MKNKKLIGFLGGGAILLLVLFILVLVKQKKPAQPSQITDIPAPAINGLPADKWDASAWNDMQKVASLEKEKQDAMLFAHADEPGKQLTHKELDPYAPQSIHDLGEEEIKTARKIFDQPIEKAENKQSVVQKRKEDTRRLTKIQNKTKSMEKETKEELAQFYTQNFTESSSDPTPRETVLAKIPIDQEIIPGQRVLMQITQETVADDGTPIPEYSFVYGIATFRTTRLQVDISDVFFNEKLYPFRLTVYDTDGIVGIYAPESETIASSKEAAADMAGSVPTGLETLSSPIIGATAQAATSATRSLLQKKAKKKPVKLKKGKEVLLVRN